MCRIVMVRRVTAKYTVGSHQNTLLLALKLINCVVRYISDAKVDRSGKGQADGHHCASQEGCCQPQSAGSFRRVSCCDDCCRLRFHDDLP